MDKHNQKSLREMQFERTVKLIRQGVQQTIMVATADMEPIFAQKIIKAALHNCGLNDTTKELNEPNLSSDCQTNDSHQSTDKYEKQLNIKLTEEDMQNITDINKGFFDNEITNSTLGRILIRKGIKLFNNSK